MSYVRRYTTGDWKQVLAIARTFHAESPIHSPHEFDEDQVRTLLTEAMGNPDYLPAVCMDDGKVIGIMLLFCLPMYFGPGTEVGDLAFYVVPDRRGTRAAKLLLDYGERWAIAARAKVMRLGVTTGIRDAAVQRFFEKNGHRPIGVLMEKQLPTTNVISITAVRA